MNYGVSGGSAHKAEKLTEVGSAVGSNPDLGVGTGG